MNSFGQCNEYKVAADDAERFTYTMLILDKRREHYPDDLMRFRRSCISTPQKTYLEYKCPIASGDYTITISQLLLPCVKNKFD